MSFGLKSNGQMSVSQFIMGMSEPVMLPLIEVMGAKLGKEAWAIGQNLLDTFAWKELSLTATDV